MKYFVANFKIECEAELMQPARELLSAAACEAGFEAFEDTDDGLLGYVQRPMYDKEALDAAIADYMPEGAAVSYAVEEVPSFLGWNVTFSVFFMLRMSMVLLSTNAPASFTFT